MLKDSFTWTIGGEAGFGINASGLIFAKTLTRSGFQIFDYIEYPSLIRGGHNVYNVRASSQEVFSQEKGIDILVALNRETFDLHRANLKKGGFVIYDEDKFEIEDREVGKTEVNLVPVPLEKLTQEVGALKVMQNNVALGASIALLDLELKNLFLVVQDIFRGKGKKIVEENQQAAQAGFDYFKNRLKGLATLPIKPKEFREEKLVLTGNEAISLGAVLGGCRFFASYPMTPASSILHILASYAETTGMVVKHAEDEISVINMAIGASFAGVRSALCTSGGGFALMEEAVSLAGITETPVVIIECQRPAPATGMPTWTDQGDLQFILRSGHGEFPKIVLAPGDQEEAFYLTAESFNLADIYQCPVFVLSDKYLSESHKSVKISNLKSQISNFKLDRGKLGTERLNKRAARGLVKPFLRYKITDDGISPWILPGTSGYFYQANSYEHREDGHTTESTEERAKQVDKRARKMETFIKEHLPTPKIYGEKNANVTLVGWGSTKMPALQAILELKSRFPSEARKPARFLASSSNLKVNYLHLNYLWPFPKEAVAKALSQVKKILLLEGNSTAQLGQLIRQETGVEIKNHYLKYDGRPFYPEEIIDLIKNL